jgi:hypothetical protein
MVGLMVAGALLTSSAAGGAEVARTLRVRVYDNAGLRKPALRAALDVAAWALSPGDVAVTWLACTSSSGGRCMEPVGKGEMVVRLVRSPKDAPAADEDSLGAALVDPVTKTGVLATVYVDRVEQLARASGGDVEMLLGRAMAHEIAHLLTGRTAHGVRGLMRPRWTRAEIVRNARVDWTFDSPELQDIRARRGM